MAGLTLAGDGFVVRSYRHDDVTALPGVAGDWQVARWMAARFPHPYTAADARAWVNLACAQSPPDHFVIEVDGLLAGGIGLTPHGGERRGVAEFGYWLGTAYWGRGLATAASRLVTAYAFKKRGMRRLEAHVFAPNTASARVLEKCGFSREAVLRSAVVDREGDALDALLYARLAIDPPL